MTCLLCGYFSLLVIIHVGVCCAVVSVSYSPAVSCWGRADLSPVVFVVFRHFPTCVLVHIRTKGEAGWFKPSSKIYLLTVPRRYFFCGSCVLFIYCVCHAFASVQFCPVVT